MFDKMRLSHDMRLSWLQRWELLDEGGVNQVSYEKFIVGCELPDSSWSRRFFSLLDKHSTGPLR